MSESTGPDNCCRRWAVLQETGMFRSVVLWLLVCGFVLFVQGPLVKGEPELSTTPNLLIFRISFFSRNCRHFTENSLLSIHSSISIWVFYVYCFPRNMSTKTPNTAKRDRDPEWICSKLNFFFWSSQSFIVNDCFPPTIVSGIWEKNCGSEFVLELMGRLDCRRFSSRNQTEGITVLRYRNTIGENLQKSGTSY